MNCSLFDALSGGFGEEAPLRLVPEDTWRLESILANLRRLLNSRRGGKRHLPDFGLPDLGEIYRGAPESYEELRQAIKDCVEKYEPRITRVRVVREDVATDPSQLRFVLTADLLSREHLKLETVFSMTEEAAVHPKVRSP